MSTITEASFMSESQDDLFDLEASVEAMDDPVEAAINCARHL